MKTKKLLSFALALALCLALAVPAAAADVNYEVAGGKLYFNAATGEISGCDKTVTEADIPSELYGVPVTGIGRSAFLGCSKLTRVTIPNSVTRIGDSAFYGCSNLPGIMIPDSVMRIENKAFSSCKNLTSITIPDSVTSIGSGAFSGSGLKSIQLGRGISEIPEGLFEACAMEELDIPFGVTKIGMHAFYNCDRLKRVSIPGSVTGIGYEAFYKCKELTSIEIPDSVKVLGEAAFRDCDALKSIRLPAGITEIPKSCFLDCNWLKSVTIQEGVTTISLDAFGDCGALTNISIPASVTDIEQSAFRNCDALKDVYYAGSIQQWTAIETGSKNDSLTSATIHFDSAPVKTAITPTVVLSSQNLMVDGVAIACEKYNIDGYNYFKLRDIASLLSGTPAKFDVSYDPAAAAVVIVPGMAYTPVGGELAIGADKSASAVPSSQKVWFLDAPVDNISIYNIGGNNFFKLRDLGTLIGFGVGYNASGNFAIIRSSVSGDPTQALEPVSPAPAPAPGHYTITCEAYPVGSANGTLTVNKTDAEAQDYIEYVATPAANYKVKEVRIIKGTAETVLSGDDLDDVLNNAGDPTGAKTSHFMMPAADLTIRAEFELIRS